MLISLISFLQRLKIFVFVFYNFFLWFYKGALGIRAKSKREEPVASEWSPLRISYGFELRKSFLEMSWLLQIEIHKQKGSVECYCC